MPLKASKFKLDEEMSLAGKTMRVAGLVQFEAANGLVATRYLLADAAGAPQIMEESGDKFALLRPFPPAASPVAAGSAVMVMGEKYALAEVRKLKILGAEGQAPGGEPKSALLLSGVFQGPMGFLLREMTPGTPAQSFYSLKPLDAGDILSAEQMAKRKEAERLAAELAAQADEEENGAAAKKPLAKAAVWIVTILVVVGLGFACSGSDEDGSSSGSARSSFSVGGGK